MRERQYLQCLHYNQVYDLDMHFQSHTGHNLFETSIDQYSLLEPINQSVPIVLSISDVQKQKFSSLAEINNNFSNNKVIPFVNLFYNGCTIAVLKNAEIFPHRKRERVHRQFGFSDIRHPAIQLIKESGDWLIGGDIQVLFISS